MNKYDINSQLLVLLRNQMTQSEELLKTLVNDFHGRELPRRNLYNKLSKYLYEFLEKRTEPRWISVAGLRGVGKTTLMAQIYFHNQKKE